MLVASSATIEPEATTLMKYAAVAPVLDERSRRRWAATESLAIGCGGDGRSPRPQVWSERRCPRGVGNRPGRGANATASDARAPDVLASGGINSAPCPHQITLPLRTPMARPALTPRYR